MVENFTHHSSPEVKNDKQADAVLENLENSLIQIIPEILQEPKQKTIDFILSYAKKSTETGLK